MEEFGHDAAEFFGTLFVGQMAGAFDDSELRGLEASGAAVRRRPDPRCGLCCPTPAGLGSCEIRGRAAWSSRMSGFQVWTILTACSRTPDLADRGGIAAKHFRGDAAGISPRSTQEVVVKGRIGRARLGKIAATSRFCNNASLIRPYSRPRVCWGDQDQPPHSVRGHGSQHHRGGTSVGMSDEIARADTGRVQRSQEAVLAADDRWQSIWGSQSEKPAPGSSGAKTSN